MLSLENYEVWSFDRLRDEYEAIAEEYHLGAWSLDQISKPQLMAWLAHEVARPLSVKAVYNAVSIEKRHSVGVGMYRSVQRLIASTVLLIHLWHHENRLSVISRQSCYRALIATVPRLSAFALERFEIILAEIVGLGQDSVREGAPLVEPERPLYVVYRQEWRTASQQTPRQVGLETVWFGCDGFNHAVLTVRDVGGDGHPETATALETRHPAVVSRCDRTCRNTVATPARLSFSLA